MDAGLWGIAALVAVVVVAAVALARRARLREAARMRAAEAEAPSEPLDLDSSHIGGPIPGLGDRRGSASRRSRRS